MSSGLGARPRRAHPLPGATGVLPQLWTAPASAPRLLSSPETLLQEANSENGQENPCDQKALGSESRNGLFVHSRHVAGLALTDGRNLVPAAVGGNPLRISTGPRTRRAGRLGFAVPSLGNRLTESPQGSTLVQKPLRPQRGSHQPRSRPRSAGRGCRALQRWWPGQRRPRESAGGGGGVSKLRAVGLTSQSRPSLSSPFLCGGHRRPQGPRRPHSVLTGLGLATAHEARLLLGAGNQGICEGPHFSVKTEDWVTHAREACEHVSTGTRTLSPHREPRERGLGASLKGGGCSRRERRVAATHPGGSRHSRGAQHGDGAGRGSSSRGPLVTPQPVQQRL